MSEEGEDTFVTFKMIQVSQVWIHEEAGEKLELLVSFKHLNMDVLNSQLPSHELC